MTRPRNAKKAGKPDKGKGRDRAAYARKKTAALERSARITRAGQDISPLPPVREPERRRLAERSFRAFCESYYPHLFALAWSADHLRVIAKIERVVLRSDCLAVAMPRGSGKTTLSDIAVVWATITGYHPFVMLVASTQEKADEALANIKTHLSTNDSLLADWPESIYPIRRLGGESRRCKGQRYYGVPTGIGWGMDEVVMATIPGSPCAGAIIRTAGITGNIRGALYVRPDGTQVRPTLVICDDPQTDASARSALQTAERLELIRGAISGLAGPGQKTAILVPCTVIQEDDLADQLCDPLRNPEWHGERTRTLAYLPIPKKTADGRDSLWARYARLREASLQADGDGREATEFYRKHHKGMVAGLEACWPARHLSEELDAIQHAMNLKLKWGERAFAAEFQNEPLPPQGMGDTILTVRQVMDRANGRARGEVPIGCTLVTMFADVHDKLLYYCVAAWQEDFTGCVIDYGTWPPQGRRLFSMDAVTRTLGRQYPGIGSDGAIRKGLDELVGQYARREFKRGAGVLRIGKLLVDAGYKPAIVEAVSHSSGGSAMQLYLGLGLKAGNKPIGSYQRRVGETIGFAWYIPSVRRTSQFPHVAADVNYWKTHVHRALAADPAEVGSLTLFGEKGEANDHELFAQHVAASETWTETVGHGRVVHEWKLKPSKPDNHWFDCLVGCAVAASMMGAKTESMRTGGGRRKKYTQADMGGR